MLRAVLFAIFACVATLPAAAQAPPPFVGEVRLEQEGRPVEERVLLDLVEPAVGRPLSIHDVREATAHLMSLNRFEDVQSFSDPLPNGDVRLRYVLVPIHVVDRVEFRGTLGLSAADIRAAMVSRFGETPPATRADEAAALLRQTYRERGFPSARVEPQLEETHDPDRATLVFVIDAGRRASISRVDVERSGPDPAGSEQIDVRVGQLYDAPTIDRELQRYEEALRSRGYYEARATHSVEFNADGSAGVTVAIDRGPRVSVAFTGDALALDERERLVPIRTEASADEDLLEDANRAIEQYLFERGYRDALVSYTRTERDGELTISFDVRRGRRHVIDYVVPTGNRVLTADEILALTPLRAGQPFIQTSLDQALAAVRNTYRVRGFTRATVQGAVSEVDPAAGSSEGDLRVRVALNITEGPRTLIGDVTFQGNTVIPEAALRRAITQAPSGPFVEAAIASDRDRIELEYRNLGYESVVVAPSFVLADGDTRADVRYAITEGVQVTVDRIIVVGNERVSLDTIERELLIAPGQPLGYAAMIESRARLSALGLFRRITIEELPHAGEPRRDVLVRVEEAPPTTIGYGGGVEGGTRLRPTGEGGQAEERFELAPRGFFEIGRRNMWGKNRAVNLLTRVSLKSRDSEVGESGYGLNEYRLFGSFREPRVFNTGADLLLTGIVDRAIRSSFSFITREARAEAGVRLSPRYTLAGRYSFKHTRLFDQNFSESEKPLIDRVFPQVRISKLSASFIRDTRDDALQPGGGRFFVADADVAPRALGSEVGFVRTYLQAFSFHRLPSPRRMVVALGARVGLAHGFRREVTRLDDAGRRVLGDDGQPIVDSVQDLPASERFFAGGDSTVRGFSLDRLGTEETISAAGFPTGGNGVIVLNAELRVSVYGPLDAVSFVDAGNVFPRAGDLDFTDLRPAAGFGVHYRSPVGPVRVELGFNLDRRQLVPGQLERGSVLHVSLGQAF